MSNKDSRWSTTADYPDYEFDYYYYYYYYYCYFTVSDFIL